MTRTYQPRERYEYRVRYRRRYGKEQQRIFGRLGTARRFVTKLKNYESADPMFPAEELVYAHIERRMVGPWDGGEWPGNER
jgi:hypothetical protein